MSYSVVIRTYNEESHIGRLLTGLLEQTVVPDDIIIVDSGSTDATLSIVSRFPVSIIKIDKSEFSFGRSLNFGCKAAKNDLILIVSAHVYPIYKNWVELMLNKFEDFEVALVYGGQCGDDTTHYSEKCIMRNWFPKDGETVQDHTFCNNANAAIRKAAWEKYKYNEELTGLEDVDFARRVKDDGYKIVYQHDAEIVHVHEQTYKQIYNRYYREALALKKIYPQERVGIRETLLLFFSNTLSDVIYSIKDRCFFTKLFDIVRFRFVQFIGTYKGFHDGKQNLKELKDRFYYPRFKRVEDNIHDLPEEMKIDYVVKR